MSSFNLIEQPWIPVVRADGTTAEVGLRDALAQAHTFQAVRDPLPTVEFGLYRLLIAVVLDVFFLEAKTTADTQTLAELLAKGKFDEAALDRYFATYADRFDLFSPTRPFLQTAAMTGEEKPVAGLLAPQPSGTAVSHFAHGDERDFAVSPAAGARLLTTIAPFMTAGGAGLSPSINGAPPIYVLLAGETLFETLCRNLFVLPFAQASGDERPVWQDRAMTPACDSAGRRTAASYAESLTWMPRRLRLTPGAGGVCSLTGETSDVLIRTMTFAPGDSCNIAWRDPNAAYRIEGTKELILRARAGRALWRDTGPIALLTEQDKGREDDKVRYARPRVINQAVEMQKTLGEKTTLNLIVYSVRTDLKMKVFEWQRETLSVPAPVVVNSAFHYDCQLALEQADRAAFLLRRALKAVYPRGGAGNDKAMNALIAYAEREFWHNLQPLYYAFLQRIASTDPDAQKERDAFRTAWKQAVIKAANVAFANAAGGLDSDRYALERLTKAQKLLSQGLFFAFETQDEKKAREQRRKDRDKAAKDATQKTTRTPKATVEVARTQEELSL